MNFFNYSGVARAKKNNLLRCMAKTVKELKRYNANIPVPGVPNRDLFYRLDLDLTLNLSESGGKTIASGRLTCVANNDGFRGLELSDCK